MEDPEQRKERKLAWYRANSETINAKRRARGRTDEERAYAREYYARNRDDLRAAAVARKKLIPIEQVREKGRAWAAADRLKNRAKWLLTGARYRSRERGMACTITVADIVIPAVCPILGIPLVMRSGGKPRADAPTLDRIDNSQGYIPGNVRVISARANRLKSDMTYDEARLLVERRHAR